MSKLKKCKSCGAEVAKSAKACPQCGAKQHQGVNVLCGIIIIVTILICIGILSGGDDTPKRVNNRDNQGQGEPSESVEPEKTSFGVGESVELKDVIVTLDAVTESKGSQFNKPSSGNVFVLCEFTIENNSSSDVGVSSLVSFEAYADDFSVNMSLGAIMEKGNKAQLDGTVAPGKKMNGVIGYEVPKDYENLEIRFTPNFWSGKDIKFVYRK